MSYIVDIFHTHNYIKNMVIRQAFKFQLMPKDEQEQQMKRFAGCCRFVWNRALALEKANYEAGNKFLSYYKLAEYLIVLKSEEETSFLKEVHSQILQQSLMDLAASYRNFFEKRAEHPRFKKKYGHNSFRYPQGFKLEENNRRIFLPKIGWVRYRKSRKIKGIIKQVIVSCALGKWYISIQTEREIEQQARAEKSEVGIDMGVARFATLSDGSYIEPQNTFRKHETKLAQEQSKLSKKVKYSSNWNKQKAKIQKMHHEIGNIRKDFLQKATTAISKNHAIVVIEDLKVKNMSKSARGTVESPGHNVKAKTGLNKSILDQGWSEFRRQLEYKLEWSGGELIVIPPQYTSQTCSHCGYIDSNNRKNQSEFKCVACGFEENADYNAALNILAAGRAVKACGAGVNQL